MLRIYNGQSQELKLNKVGIQKIARVNNPNTSVVSPQSSLLDDEYVSDDYYFIGGISYDERIGKFVAAVCVVEDQGNPFFNSKVYAVGEVRNELWIVDYDTMVVENKIVLESNTLPVVFDGNDQIPGVQVLYSHPDSGLHMNCINETAMSNGMTVTVKNNKSYAIATSYYDGWNDSSRSGMICVFDYTDQNAPVRKFIYGDQNLFTSTNNGSSTSQEQALRYSSRSRLPGGNIVVKSSSILGTSNAHLYNHVYAMVLDPETAITKDGNTTAILPGDRQASTRIEYGLPYNMVYDAAGFTYVAGVGLCSIITVRPTSRRTYVMVIDPTTLTVTRADYMGAARYVHASCHLNKDGHLVGADGRYGYIFDVQGGSTSIISQYDSAADPSPPFHRMSQLDPWSENKSVCNFTDNFVTWEATQGVWVRFQVRDGDNLSVYVDTSINYANDYVEIWRSAAAYYAGNPDYPVINGDFAVYSALYMEGHDPEDNNEPGPPKFITVLASKQAGGPRDGEFPKRNFMINVAEYRIIKDNAHLSSFGYVYNVKTRITGTSPSCIVTGPGSLISFRNYYR